MSGSVTVAVDASWLRDGGIARMATEILSRRPPHVDLIEIRSDAANAGMMTPLDLARQARAVSADVIWSPGFMPPLFAVPGKRVCITIHDLAHLRHYSARHRLYYRHVIRPLLRNVDRIFTVSDFTHRELTRWIGREDGRIVRIYNGVSHTFDVAGPRAASEPPYILYVGNRRGYKNIERLIAAFADSSLVEAGYALRLTGDPDPALLGWATRYGVAGRIAFLGRLSDPELAAAYRGARALAFVSLYEGFGLPVVEAMACGCPVITANTTALGEVAGDAALTVDPHSISGIAAGLERVCLDATLRDRLGDAGRRRAATFRWDVAAEQYWHVLTAS